MIRIGIVGAGRRGTALLRSLQGKEGFEIVGNTDLCPAAPGLHLACRYGIPVRRNVQELLQPPYPDLLIDATGDPKALSPIQGLLPPETELLSGNAVRLLGSLSTEPDRLPAALPEPADAVVTLDPKERITFWSREAEILLGYQPEEILGQPFLRLVPVEHRKEMKKLLSPSDPREFTRDYETEQVAKDGTVIPVSITLREVRDRNGHRVSLTGILRDRRENSRHVRETENYYRELTTLHEISRTVFSSLDLHTVLKGILQRLIALGAFDVGIIHLLDAEEHLLEPVASWGYRDPKRVKMHFQGPASAIRLLNCPAVRVEENVPLCDGLRTFKAEGVQAAIVVPVRDRDLVVGAIQLGCRCPRKFSALEVDLLEAIGSQMGLAVQKARLYEETLQAYAQLKANHKQMTQVERLRALGELASGVAHDFNNLLTTILGRTEVLLDTVTDPEIRRSLEVIQKATLDGASTVQRVQEFAGVKSETPYTLLDPAAVIADAIEFTANRWQKESRAAGVEITIRNLCQQLPGIQGSAAQLREVFTNLILNAVDAMPQGGTITLQGHTSEDSLFLDISDTGTGISAEAQKRVFEPFFTTKHHKGTGLGLSIVEGIIQRHHGAITVRSEESQGTTFTIQFPISPLSEVKKPRNLPREDDSAATILVVDDEDGVRDILCEILRLAGYRVHGASSGPEGIACLKEKNFDLVFTDLRMNGATGWDVARAARDTHPDLPVVLVTAWAKEVTPKQMREYRVARVVTKPFHARDISEITSRLLPRGRREALRNS